MTASDIKNGLRVDVHSEMELSKKLAEIQEELCKAEDHLDLFHVETKLNAVSRAVDLFCGKVEYIEVLDERKIANWNNQIADIRKSIAKKYIDILNAHFKNAEDYFCNMNFPVKRYDDKYLDVSAGSVIASAILEKMQHGTCVHQEQLEQLERGVYNANKAFNKAQVYFTMNEPEFAGLSDGEYFKNHFMRLEDLYLPSLKKEAAVVTASF